MSVLVNKLEKDAIISFKLVNGDEIVAKIVEEQADDYIISKPCTVIPSNQGLALMQSLYTSELNNNITLKKSHVMLYSPTVDQVKNYYIETTTGIEPVSKGGIIT